MDWRWIVFALLVAFLLYQVIVPFVMIIWTSFKTSSPGDPGFLAFDFTIENYVRAFSAPSFWKATGNTLYFAAASTAVAFILGTFLSWVVDRTNTPFARLIGILTLARIIIPGILIAISWIFLASPRIGFLTDIVRHLAGVPHAVNIYTFWGMVWVHGLEMVPLAYLLISAAFQAMDPRLEEASTMTGAGMTRTLRRITLPLIAPAILAALLLLFVTAIETFEVPLLLGGRAGINVYTTEVYFSTARSPIDLGMSSTYSIALVVISIALLAVYFALLRHGERYQTITGKDYRPRRTDLGRWKYATCGASLLLVFLITGLPFIIMLYASFLPAYVGITLQPFSVLSLENYRELLAGGLDAYAINPMVNSTLVGTRDGDVRHGGRGGDRVFRAQKPNSRPEGARFPRIRLDRHTERRPRDRVCLVLSSGPGANTRHADHHRSRLSHEISAVRAALRIDLYAPDPFGARRGSGSRGCPLVEELPPHLSATPEARTYGWMVLGHGSRLSRADDRAHAGPLEQPHGIRHHL